MNQFEREEEAIMKMEDRGELTHAQAIKELRELRRDYEQAGRDAAQEAYDRELERW